MRKPGVSVIKTPRVATPVRSSRISIDKRVIRPILDWGKVGPLLPSLPPREFRISVRRPDDLLVFDLVFEQMKLGTGPAPVLVRKAANAAAYLVVEFPPQSFGEQAFLELSAATSNKEVTDVPGYPKKNAPNPGEAVPALPSARIRMSGPSRIAFTMPATQDELPYSLAGVLEAVRTWPLRLDFNATPDVEVGLQFDREWLTVVTRSEQWRAASMSLAGGLEATGATGIERAIARAGTRISKQAAQAMSGATPAAMRKEREQLAQAMVAEIEQLAQRYPQLQDAQARETGLAALAVSATGAYAGSRAGRDFTLEAVERFPFLPIVLGPHPPAKSVTALEVPYRLILSPLPGARWTHRDVPVERNGRIELWHTRLKTAPPAATDRGPDGDSRVRAIWSPDYPSDHDDQITDLLPLLEDPVKPFRISLDPLDRRMLVRLMAGFNEKSTPRRAYRPASSLARRLHLSSLGALLDVEGTWTDRPERVGLEQWRHLATLGRDQYVRVVYAGFLCNLRHAASLVKVTERKFESLGGDRNQRIAVLRQRFFIIVREPVRTYDGSGHQFFGHNFPFTKVEILTRVTPNLLPPEAPQAVAGVAGVPPRAAFWPMLNATDNFRFEVAATDICGNRVTFSMPLMFVGDEANQPNADAAITAYNAADASKRRTAWPGGAVICYAPVKAGTEGDPRLPTSSILFTAARASGKPKTEARFYPELAEADVGIRAVQRLLGKNDASVRVKYTDIYKTAAFGGGNPGEVFLETIGDFGLKFGDAPGDAKSDALGALAAPAMAIKGLSRIMGPTGDVAEAIANKFDPAKFFDGAKILGGIPLASLLKTVSGLTGAAVPKMLSREIAADATLPARVEASFTWDTVITQQDPAKLFVHTAGGQPTRLAMRGVVSAPIASPAAATFEATATLDNFKVDLFGFIIIWFDLLRFEARRGAKPDVAVDLHPGNDAIRFGGPLEFVNELRRLIPSNGFSDPPNLAVTPSGITASFSLNLPDVGVGIFVLSNVSLGAGFSLPFDAKPATVRFNFAERQQPFSLTVSMLGGGGFLAIGIGSEGVREIEAALEFGAAVAINLGVASGSVEIKAGVYFHWLETGGKRLVELTGYVRLHGELSVLGLISASLTFNLQLSYLKEGTKSTVWGEATLTIEIEVLFFSADVSVTCRREFGGSQADPKFIELIPDEAVWTGYCEAFAMEEA